MAKTVDAARLASRFRGCLVGALVGDCLGANFEGKDSVSSNQLNKFIDSLSDKDCSILKYTDDTAMTRCVAQSLIENKKYVAEDMANKFADEYYEEPNRGYGMNVSAVFDSLHKKEYGDVYEASKKQFNGSGSYGNGGAMRVSPVALFSYQNFEKMIEIARLSTQITHFHPEGYNGAILQCLAVHEALKQDNSIHLNTEEFLSSIVEKMKVIERPENDALHSKLPFCYKLEKIYTLLDNEKLPKRIVYEELGNGVPALKSVPTAILSFLKATKPMQDFPDCNHFERTIMYAISLGGDTDTIASMAGAIAGAYFGIDVIPKIWQTKCEGLEIVIKQAEELFKIQNL